MAVAETIALIQAADALLHLLQNAGVSKAKFDALRAQNAGGRLTAEQVQTLASEARQAVSALYPAQGQE
jgi:hypothetical protein